MTTKALTAEIETWFDLPENANVPKISADEAIDAIVVGPLQDAEPSIKKQVAWLVDFIARWDAEQRAEDICAKWVAKLGVGFHPDTRGADYSPVLSAPEIEDYERDMAVLCDDLSVCPYSFGLDAIERAGLI